MTEKLFMETRIARLETDVRRLQRDVVDLEARMLRLRPRDPIDLPLLLCFGLVTAVLLAALAHGFGWI